LCIYLLDINLDALIVYANGIFIMIYLLCMLAGCRLLRGRYRLLAVVGSILCLLLLAMVGWKSLYALVMLAVLWLFLPKRRLAEVSRPEQAARAMHVNRGDRLYGPDGRAVHPYAGIPLQRSRRRQFRR
jgi:hypothetical protein